MALTETLVGFFNNMDFFQILIIVIIIMAIGGIVFRKFIFMLFLDYVIDFGLSFLDNFIGVGLIGLDIGDWVAALIIFSSLRKITGTPVALLVAWEATNFFPISLIPVVGEFVEVFTNLLPSAAIATLLFNKFGAAKRGERQLEEDIAAGKALGLTTRKQEQLVRKVKELLQGENPVEALREAKETDEKISEQLRDAVGSIISETEQIISSISGKRIEAPPELIRILQNGVDQAEQLLEQAAGLAQQKKIAKAVQVASQAHDTIQAAIQEFQNQMQTMG